MTDPQTEPARVGRDLPPDLARRLDETIARGDVDGYLALLRETDEPTADVDLSADEEAHVWREAALLGRDALSPLAAAILPRFIADELLAYDDAPDPPRGADLVGSLLLAGPWIACSTGWALVVAASSGVAAVTRWIRP